MADSVVFVHPDRPGEERTADTEADRVRLRFDGWTEQKPAKGKAGGSQ